MHLIKDIFKLGETLAGPIINSREIKLDAKSLQEAF
jgi:hypothetical protein